VEHAERPDYDRFVEHMEICYHRFKDLLDEETLGGLKEKLAEDLLHFGNTIKWAGGRLDKKYVIEDDGWVH